MIDKKQKLLDYGWTEHFPGCWVADGEPAEYVKNWQGPLRYTKEYWNAKFEEVRRQFERENNE